MPKIVCISDTHDWDLNDLNIPDGDILIHAGDATGHGTVSSLIAFNQQLGELPHKHKIVIAGNHDWLFQRSPDLAKTIMSNATYLQNSGTVIDGLKFWGSPATPRFFDWAFNYDRGEDIKKFWDAIPDDTDVLITHGPPYGFGDLTTRAGHVGCQDLLDAVRRVNPKVHVFGHIHYAYGVYQSNRTLFVNAAICSERYNPVNPAIVVDL